MTTTPNPHSRRTLRAAGATIAAGALALALVSCAEGGASDGDVQSAVSMRSEGPTSGQDGSGDAASAMSTDISPTGEFMSGTAEALPATGTYLGIKDVRIGSHDGADRIVFEFVGEGTPGYWIRYEDMPAQQGSGRPISVAGDNKLSIDVRGTGYPFDFDMDDYPSGPVRPTDTAAIKEVVGAGTFEGSSQYVAGVDGERRLFRVSLAQNPTRLIIDIKTS